MDAFGDCTAWNTKGPKDVLFRENANSKKDFILVEQKYYIMA